MFDLHCDTLLKVRKGGSLQSNAFDVSFEKLSKYKKAGQLFAIYNPCEFSTKDMLDIIDLLKKEARQSSVAEFCVTAQDYKNCNVPVSAFVSLEGMGNTPGFSIANLYELYDAGVRIAGFTWNMDNVLCGGIGDNALGLTELGREVLSEMEKLSMGFDVSHISDRGFWDAAEYENVRMLATHSNSRTVCPVERNLTDEQFEVIRARGGVVGLNLYPLFLNDSESADVNDLIRHIEHFCSIGGENTIALGADFDGIGFKMSDIDSCEKLDILFNELARLNYPQSLIDNIAQDNFIRFFESLNI